LKGISRELAAVISFSSERGNMSQYINSLNDGMGAS
jgi:hypothetical protein